MQVIGFVNDLGQPVVLNTAHIIAVIGNSSTSHPTTKGCKIYTVSSGIDSCIVCYAHTYEEIVNMMLNAGGFQ